MVLRAKRQGLSRGTRDAGGGSAADHDLTLIIPAFNEEKRLPWTLGELRSALHDWGIDYRVVVADDGSSDRTPTLAGLFGPRFSTVSLAEHRGKGCAVRTAMLRATGRVVAFTDADLPYELSALRDGYEPVRSGAADVVFGARDVAGARHLAPRRLSRILTTWVFRSIVKRLISSEVTDTQCGLKIFSLSAAREIFSRTTLDGFAFDAEVVLLTEQLGLPYHRIPVNLAERTHQASRCHATRCPCCWTLSKSGGATASCGFLRCHDCPRWNWPTPKSERNRPDVPFACGVGQDPGHPHSRSASAGPLVPHPVAEFARRQVFWKGM